MTKNTQRKSITTKNTQRKATTQKSRSTRPSVAVVGGGVAGLCTAYLLRDSHDVTLYEAEDRLGGHAHTHVVDFAGTCVAVDSGFMVFNPERYPYLVSLFEELDIETTETVMTFSVDIPGEVTFRGNFPKGIFADSKNLLRPKFYKFLREIVRFRELGKKSLDDDSIGKLTLAEFFEKHGFSDELGEWFVYPMLAAVWSMKDDTNTANFPALATLRFLDNHKLLNQFRPSWRTVVNGSKTYVDALEAALVRSGVKIHTTTPVSSVERKEGSIQVTARGTQESFDAVVLATHANTAKAMLSDANAKEKRALGRFTYSDNEAVLHSDTTLLPQNPRAVAAWNYMSNARPSDPKSEPAFTYNMNELQHISAEYPLFVTLNATDKIDPKKIHATMQYAHPEYTLDSLRGQAEITKIQGDFNTYFAGAHLGFGFHEDGAASAVAVVKAMGVEVAWRGIE